MRCRVDGGGRVDGEPAGCSVLQGAGATIVCQQKRVGGKGIVLANDHNYMAAAAGAIKK